MDRGQDQDHKGISEKIPPPAGLFSCLPTPLSPDLPQTSTRAGAGLSPQLGEH